MKFAPGDLVRNFKTNEDGKVIEAYQDNGVAKHMDNGVAKHMVSVPKDPSGWDAGAQVAYWPEEDLDFSTNDLLNEPLGEGNYA